VVAAGLGGPCGFGDLVVAGDGDGDVEAEARGDGVNVMVGDGLVDGEIVAVGVSDGVV
jgi:hypothetical protein